MTVAFLLRSVFAISVALLVGSVSATAMPLEGKGGPTGFTRFPGEGRVIITPAPGMMVVQELPPQHVLGVHALTGRTMKKHTLRVSSKAYHFSRKNPGANQQVEETTAHASGPDLLARLLYSAAPLTERSVLTQLASRTADIALVNVSMPELEQMAAGKVKLVDSEGAPLAAGMSLGRAGDDMSSVLSGLPDGSLPLRGSAEEPARMLTGPIIAGKLDVMTLSGPITLGFSKLLPVDSRVKVGTGPAGQLQPEGIKGQRVWLESGDFGQEAGRQIRAYGWDVLTDVGEVRPWTSEHPLTLPGFRVEDLMRSGQDG